MMMEITGFASPKSESFPAGLRVLVVDDDPTWLKILEKMLKKCSYEVTTCGLAREALDLLRVRKDGFDIVISDVNMPDMDGFKLLEHVGLEMDLPVIMMSVDGETSRVMKGVQHGACDYLLKPIRMKELRNIWQHVFRKRIHEVRDIEFHEGMDEIQMLRNGCELYEERHFPCGSDSISGRKRKDIEGRNDDRECNDPLSAKKTRVVWTVELHQKFVNAVHHIGFEKVGPKKILDMMAVPWLTRENVASHLQKYRLYLGRLQKEKELTGSYASGMKHSDIVSSKEPNANHVVQNPVNKQHIRQNIDFKIHDGDKKCTVLVPIAEPNKALSAEMKHAATMHKQFNWEEETSRGHIGKDCKPHFQPKNRFKFNPLPLTSICQSVTINPKPSSLERDIPAKLSPVGNTGLFSAQPERRATNGQVFKQIPSNMWSLDQILEEPAARSPILANGSILGPSWDDNSYYSSLHGEFQQVNIFPDNISSLNYSSPELHTEMQPAFLYDSLKYEVEFPFESMIDHSLFIV